ncbi:MAG: HlyD family efflux transporter periplasmic adaptor subunit [Sediminibacterium sp.]|nr:HlyD family efflux transporter periplasmic adaptor subunit [Sediminibacterium sp.]
MDRVIEKKRIGKKQVIYILGGVGFLVLLMWAYSFSTKKTVRVEKEKVISGSVTFGDFEDVILQSAGVEPLNSVYVNSLQGGVVERIFVEDGGTVQEGTPLLKLNNPNVQMSYLSQQTGIIQNISQLRSIKLQLETKERELKENQMDMEARLDKAQRQFAIDSSLYAKGTISKLEYDNSARENKLQASKRTILKETIDQENRNRARQLEDINKSIGSLESQLELIRENYENLTIKAPVTGRLSSFDPIIGKNYSSGELLGKIDVLNGYKLVAQVDEYYITRLKEGQKGRATFNGKEFNLLVKKVLPEVVKGMFTVELKFENEMPEKLSRGLTAQIKISLSDNVKTLLVPRGQFFEATGGNWIFVKKGDKAYKRTIKVGRKNYQSFEVLEGLEKNEEVLISGYDGLTEYDEIIIE